jgi:hypothetical protein
VYSIRSKWKTLLVRLLLFLAVSATSIIAAIVESSAGPPTPAPNGSPAPAPIPLPSNLEIPRYYPGPPPFRSGETLIYQASWIGIPAAEARILLSNDAAGNHSWSGKLWLRSSPAVDVLYRMRDYVSEDFNRDDLRPREMHILQHEKRRRDEWSIRFDDHEHLVTSAKRNAQGRTWIREFSGGEPWGPFSGAMLALSLPLKVGGTYTFDVFSGGNRYVLAFDIEQREALSTSMGVVHALRIIPSVVWLSEGKFLNQVSRIVLWVTEDEPHIPLRIEAAAFVGNIRVDLTEVLNGPRPNITAAAAQTPGAEPPQQFSPFLIPLSSLMP